jgi:tryptophan aminotransferase
LPLEFTPGIISMLAGKPNPSMFPITSMSITVRSPYAKEGSSSERTITINGPTLTEALQYGPTAGSPDAVKWYKGLQELAHKRPQGTDWSLSMGSGSQDVLYKARIPLPISTAIIIVTGIIGLSCDSQPRRISLGRSASLRVSMIPLSSSWKRPLPNLAFRGVIPLLKAQSADCVGEHYQHFRYEITELLTEIDTDEHGVSTQSMRDVLANWPASKAKPKVFYTVPVSLLLDYHDDVPMLP